MAAAITPPQNRGKYISYMALLVVAGVVLYAMMHYPIFGLREIGDESYYKGEVDFMARYGPYHSLAQGTSFVYTCLVFLFSKVFFTTFLAATRILALTSFLGCCWVLVRCLDFFPAINAAERFLCLSFYSIISKDWILRGLPDLPAMFFFLCGLLLVLQFRKYGNFALAGVLVFMGVACKPVVLLTIPGFIVLMFFRQWRSNGWKTNIFRTVVFLAGFTVCFIVYHIPGFQEYHKLMLENKEHVYQGDKRIDSNPGRREVEIYYVTVPNSHTSILQLTFAEVAAYKELHPGVNLNLSYSQYVTGYFGSFLKNSFEKIFVVLPYYIQNGFFYSKWTSVNRWVHNLAAIHILSAVLLVCIFVIQRRFIKETALYFFLPFSYAVILALYSIGHYEDNWLLLCMPFLALPVVKFLCRYLNIYLLLALQFVFIWIH